MDDVSDMLDAVHMLIGCDWGRRIASPTDSAPCKQQAIQRVVLHDEGGAAEGMVQVCEKHWHVIMEETTPHREDA
jgi:hypothetical protein